MTTMSESSRVPAPAGRPHNWGRWGADDQRGSLNLLGPDTTLAARDAITEGAFYSLGMPVQSRDVPLVEYRGVPMRLTLQDGTDAGSTPPEFGCPAGTGAHEDVLVMASHTTTHMDALIHVYGDYSHYNGVPFEAMHAMAGATRLGIENIGGIVARAVILDMVRHFGAENWLEPGQPISAADLEAAAAAKGLTVGAGDVVLVRTGYLQYWFAHRPVDYSQPGLTMDAATWLAERDVVAVGGDNAAVEVLPFDRGSFLGVHKILLVDHGIYLLEYLDLSAPAAAGHYEGMLTVGPLKVTGATGSPINPIFIA